MMNGQSHVHDWDSDRVSEWLAQNGLSMVDKKFRENDITGDVLVHTDLEMLGELKIQSVGIRISILKAIYNLKREYGIAVEEGDWRPETAVEDGDELHVGEESLSPALRAALKERGQEVNKLSRDIRRLAADLHKLREEVQPLMKMTKEFKHILDKERGRDSSKRSKNSSSRSQKITLKMPPPRDRPSGSRTTPPGNSPTRSPGASDEAIKVYGDKLLHREHDTFKTCPVSPEDTCSKVLSAALKKYKLSEDWHNYQLVIVTKSGKEKRLAHAEKPLTVFNQFKEMGEEPTCVLRPLSSSKSSSHTPGRRVPPNARTYESRSPVDSQWETGRAGTSDDRQESDHFANEVVIQAVAIYEYTAQRDDELTVIIGDSVVIRDRTTGWCIVDKAGVRGWVPSGCLLEENADQQYPESAYPMEAMAMYDYRKIGPNELSLKAGERLLIRKHYQHWLKAECRGEQGFVPSLYVSIENASPRSVTSNYEREVGVSPQKSARTGGAGIAAQLFPPKSPTIPAVDKGSRSPDASPRKEHQDEPRPLRKLEGRAFKSAQDVRVAASQLQDRMARFYEEALWKIQKRQRNVPTRSQESVASPVRPSFSESSLQRRLSYLSQPRHPVRRPTGYGFLWMNEPLGRRRRSSAPKLQTMQLPPLDLGGSLVDEVQQLFPRERLETRASFALSSRHVSRVNTGHPGLPSSGTAAIREDANAGQRLAVYHSAEKALGRSRSGLSGSWLTVGTNESDSDWMTASASSLPRSGQCPSETEESKTIERSISYDKVEYYSRPRRRSTHKRPSLTDELIDRTFEQRHRSRVRLPRVRPNSMQLKTSFASDTSFHAQSAFGSEDSFNRFRALPENLQQSQPLRPRAHKVDSSMIRNKRTATADDVNRIQRRGSPNWLKRRKHTKSSEVAPLDMGFLDHAKELTFAGSASPKKEFGKFLKRFSSGGKGNERDKEHTPRTEVG